MAVGGTRRRANRARQHARCRQCGRPPCAPVVIKIVVVLVVVLLLLERRPRGHRRRRCGQRRRSHLAVAEQRQQNRGRRGGVALAARWRQAHCKNAASRSARGVCFLVEASLKSRPAIVLFLLHTFPR